MLDLMRKHARSWLIKAALGGIIVVFVFFFGWSGPQEESGSYVAEVNGTAISYNYYRSELDSTMESIRRRFGGNMPPGLFEKLDLKKKVAKNLIDGLLLQQEATRVGFYVTDEDLVESIRSDPVFQRNGVFDNYVYESFLQDIKKTAAEYEFRRRELLLQSRLVSVLVDSVKTNPDKVKRMWHFQNDKLALAMITIQPDPAAGAASVDENELAAFFEKNRSKYEIPAMLDLEYVVFSWRDLLNKVPVSDEKAKAYYEANPAEFTEPEQVHARHILLRVPENADDQQTEEIKKKIEEIRKEIEGGEDFTAKARELSQDEATAENGGDLGFFARGKLNPDIEDAAFDLKPGGLSEPVLTKQGYHLIRVDEKKPEKRLTFAEVKQRIVDKLMEEKARKKVNEDADAFYEQVYRQEQLKKPAEEFGFAVREGKSISSAQGLPELGPVSDVMDQAFQLSIGEISQLIRTGENFLIMKLVNRVDERVPELAEVRREAAKDYGRHKALQAATRKAEEIIKELTQASADPEEVAKQFGLTWQNLDPVSRTIGLVPRLGNSPQVNEMLTAVSPTNPVFRDPIPITGGVAVVRLVDVRKADEDQFAKQAPGFETWVKEVSQTEIRDGWLKRLREDASIKFNEKFL